MKKVTWPEPPPPWTEYDEIKRIKRFDEKQKIQEEAHNNYLRVCDPLYPLKESMNNIEKMLKELVKTGLEHKE